MKEIYTKDLKNDKFIGKDIELFAWLANKRTSKNIVFYDIVDSTGKIQVVIPSDLDKFKIESSLKIVGTLQYNNAQYEVIAKSIELIGDVIPNISPSPRSNFDCLDTKNFDNVQKFRHLYIRNPKIIAILKARDLVASAVRKWFKINNYCEITAPILTPVLLYDEDTGIKTTLGSEKEPIFLTQCVGFYLESAVHALEKVYNIGPSFRGKETSSRRHLTEYWHVKSEVAFCKFSEMFDEVESFLKFIVTEINDEAQVLASQIGTKFCLDAINVPFKKITYIEALKILKDNGIEIEFGRSLNAKAETFISNYFGSPVWIMYNPRSVEGFPYCIHPLDDRLTLTADLIATNGHGELLGIAEKTTDVNELCIRMAEKNKDKNPQYDWFKQIRDFGTVPHCGMGMGLERLIKWLFDIEHVRDVMPFPRNIGRKIYP